MQFPSRDLTSQPLCVTYVDVVQRYTSSALPTDVYLLDGQGNVIEYSNLTSSNAVISQFSLLADTASYAVSASYEIITEISSSHADSASYAISSSVSVSSSYAAYAARALSASYAPQSGVITNAETASYVAGSSVHGDVESASYALTASYAIYSVNVTTSLNNATTSLISISNSIYNSMFVSYVLTDTQNFRAGNIVVLYSSSLAVLTETCTTDIGNSDALQFSASISASNVNLLAINLSNDDYSVKYHYDVL